MYRKLISPVTICFMLFLNSFAAASDGYDLWMNYNNPFTNITEPNKTIASRIILNEKSATVKIIKTEMEKAVSGLTGNAPAFTQTVTGNGDLVIGNRNSDEIIKTLNLNNILSHDGFIIKSSNYNGFKIIAITSDSDAGLLYGMFHFIRLIQTGANPEKLDIITSPKIQLRLLNHWDNLNGSVERGYAGNSLWKWAELPEKIDPRYIDYARANASLGINGTVLNNVNATPEILTPNYLKKVAALADVFRPYGVKVYLSINFSSPLKPQPRGGGIGDLGTSDPLDPQVQQWWKAKAKEIYTFIPDFGGFLIKANSEGMPGPQDYGRTQTEGANMLAQALAPYNGIVMWRAFVYDAGVDADRVKRAYKEFVPLDGTFENNVMVQVKNGPLDFQPREPVHPLFGAMPHTPLMLELQITKEYLGHAKHLVYLAPMWKECLEFDTYAAGQGSTVAQIIDGSVHDYQLTGIAGVTNIGDDRNWCGHLFNQANWYAFGRLAWDHTLTSETIADEWVRLTLGSDPATVNSIKSLMMGSWEACINYMTPLGLHHIMQEGFHYGPGPAVSSSGRIDWNSVYYHKADSLGIGFDRSETGSNAVSQYYLPVREQYANVATCPEKYLLWFHHVSWDYKTRSGKTLWDEMCYDYDSGIDYVKKMQTMWASLRNKVDPEIFAHVTQKLEIQKKDAAIWRDTCVNYFQQFSKKPVPKFNN